MAELKRKYLTVVGNSQFDLAASLEKASSDFAASNDVVVKDEEVMGVDYTAGGYGKALLLLTYEEIPQSEKDKKAKKAEAEAKQAEADAKKKEAAELKAKADQLVAEANAAQKAADK